MKRRKRKVTKAATLKALQGSIRKWEHIVDGSGMDKGDRAMTAEQIVAARAELDFLRSLLKRFRQIKRG